MTEPATDADAFEGPDRGPITGLPHWVKVSAIIVLALVLLFAVLQLTGVQPGGHDPGGRMDHGLGDEAPVVGQEQAIEVPLSPVLDRAVQQR